MVNNINAFELSDEQLETVTGGSEEFFAQQATNGNLQLNLAAAPTENVSAFNFGKLDQNGAKITQTSTSSQQAGKQHYYQQQ